MNLFTSGSPFGKVFGSEDAILEDYFGVIHRAATEFGV